MTAVGRRARYFWVRCFYCMVLFLMLWSVYEQTHSYGWFGSSQAKYYQAFAQAFFWGFSLTQLSLVLLLTPAYVAATVAVEYQRRTIEYLFATDLSNSEIVLGKWAARTLNIIVLLLAALPIISAAMLFGSIDPTHVLLIMGINVACVVSTAALAILVSVYSKDARAAITQSYTFLGLLLLSPLGVGGLLYAVEDFAGQPVPVVSDFLRSVTDWLTWGQPFLFMVQTLSTGGQYDLFGEQVLMMAGMHFGFALVCLSIAIVRIRRVQLRDTVKSLRRLGKVRSTLTVGKHPMIWKEWRFDTERRRRWVAIAFNFLVWGGLYGTLLTMLFFYVTHFDTARSKTDEGLNALVRVGGTLILVFALLRTAVRSAGAISAERDRDTWLSLIATPLSEEAIIYGKLIGGMKSLFWTCVLLCPLWFVAIAFGGLSLLALPILLIAVASYGFFTAALGVHQSLSCKSTTSALGTTLTICVLLGGVGQAFSGCVLALLQMTGIDGEILMQAMAVSIPWLVLGGSAFRAQDINGIDEPEIMIMATLFVVGYAVAGMILTARSVERFAHFTGRTQASRRAENTT